MKSGGFFNNWIVKNILWAIVLLSVLILGTEVFLSVYTRHGDEITVPDFTSFSVPGASELAGKVNMRTEVVDSIYVRNMPHGTVVRQDPLPGVRVKEGRRIRLTINAVSPKMVSMPNLVGFSYRSASAELVSRGLAVGRLIYVNDIATNNVLRQLHRNVEIAPGEMIASDSKVDLVLGLDPSDNLTVVPELVGAGYDRAVSLIHESCLNVGGVAFDRSVRTYADSLKAVVYRQAPAGGIYGITKGREVSIYLRVE